MLSRSQRLKAGGIALAAAPLVAMLGRTWRWRVDGAQHYDTLVRLRRPPILALWHGRILSATLYWRDHGIVALTSRNFDGEWIAQLMARFGYRAARGSTSRGGAPALVQLRRELTAGHSVAFTVDGPRGPARVVQPGAVWLAGATQHPILPFHLEADRFWSARSWDAAQIPKPFGTVAIAIGEPLHVPDTSEAVIEAKRLELTTCLAALEHRSRQMLHSGRIEPRGHQATKIN